MKYMQNYHNRNDNYDIHLTFKGVRSTKHIIFITSKIFEWLGQISLPKFRIYYNVYPESQNLCNFCESLSTAQACIGKAAGWYQHLQSNPLKGAGQGVQGNTKYLGCWFFKTRPWEIASSCIGKFNQLCCCRQISS